MKFSTLLKKILASVFMGGLGYIFSFIPMLIIMYLVAIPLGSPSPIDDPIGFEKYISFFAPIGVVISIPIVLIAAVFGWALIKENK